MKSILLIENNPQMLDNVREYLELFEYRILCAKNGSEGLILANSVIPDLIICDVLMPDMDGFEVLRNIRRTIGTASIPFIFSTSLSENMDRAQALLMGADEYIVKPFEIEDLLVMIKTCMGNKVDKTEPEMLSNE
ncbi:MAG: response regulator transcription factor [Bacteroidia bacterium]